MRLYNIYYICSICKETIEESISLEQIKNSAGTVTYRINGWRDCRKALEQIRNVSCFKEQAESVYESLGVVERDKDNPIVTSDVRVTTTLTVKRPVKIQESTVPMICLFLRI